MSSLLNIELKNGQLNKYQFSYEKNRDCVEGQEAVKSSANAMKYLPKLSGHITDPVFGQQLYNNYKNYAYYFPSAGRTVDGYAGIAFRKTPTITINEKEKFENDFTLDGQPLVDFAKNVFEEVVVNYRPVLLVDYSEDAKRAYTRMYKTLDVLDWRVGYIEGVSQVNFVKLYETVEIVNPNDEFESIIVDQIRVLDIDETGYYRSRVYQRTDSGESNELTAEYQQVGEDMYPTIRNQKMRSIPVIPVSPVGQTWDLDYSPVNDLTDVSISYYRTSASYQNALLLTGNPTPCFKGLMSEENEVVGLGSSKVLEFQPEGGHSWFLTLGSEGVIELRTQLDTLKNDMAVVGARILSSDPSGVEAAETAQIHRAGEQSVLMSISASVSRAIEKALKLSYVWTYDENIDDISFNLNVDFDTTGMNPQMITQLFQLHSAGKISFEALYRALEKGEVYPEDWSLEQELEKIEEDNKENKEKQGQLAIQGLEDEEIVETEEETEEEV
jgi:hypothetical protein